ncbi:Chorismate mutase 2 [Striga hermonthica]|uniref:chorismate mutase n=1 Tax=Striga hermonthica TaxID=68872 RepID=A0A9N7MN57_STRHE|nr:Chorismate mutase 2 [Striga hermonthica]
MKFPLSDDRAQPSLLKSLYSELDSYYGQEDSIVFCLIERSKYPINSGLYDDKYSDRFSSSLLEFFIKESEALQAKAGRYTSEEENAFFPDNLPSPILPSHDHTPVLHPQGASININDKILNELYLKNLLPLIAGEDDFLESNRAFFTEQGQTTTLDC